MSTSPGTLDRARTPWPHKTQYLHGSGSQTRGSVLEGSYWPSSRPSVPWCQAASCLYRDISKNVQSCFASFPPGSSPQCLLSVTPFTLDQVNILEFK
ncbi:hypothetical protein E2C01_063546 [Portunus trituberculatus]|uniref:Uncharacterized protein n=1 Tax=Portunus trituberculatus TaxID=210409 RepID=A0A5B7HIG0_PORTR|nr:hypothetical protein [Portunus trituberculatus]